MLEVLVNVTFPVFAIIGIGYLTGVKGILGPESIIALNRFVFYFALPAALFLFTARAPVSEVFNVPFLTAFLLGIALTLIIALAGGRWIFHHESASLTLHGFSAVFANTTFLGLPLFLTAFGEEKVLPTIVATIAYMICLMGGVIITLEISQAKERSLFMICKEVSRTLVRNPLLIASFLGISFSLLALPVYKPVDNFLGLMAASAGPTALFALGLSLVGQSVLGHIGEVAWLVVLKLIVQPLLTFLLVTYIFEMDPFWAKSAVLLSALPGATTVYVVAQQYNNYVQQASASILISTLFSLLSVTVVLVFLEI